MMTATPPRPHSARAIERAGDDPGFRDRITDCLARILESLASRGPAGREHPVGTRVADLLRQVRPETLRRMLWLEGDGAARAACCAPPPLR